MSEDETEILVNPEMRIIKQVTVADVEKANQLFDDLMGNAVGPRKNSLKIILGGCTIWNLMI